MASLSTPPPETSRPVRLRDLPIWWVPMWTNLVLMVAPILGLQQSFGRVSRETAGWAWAVLGVVALATGIFGRKHPLARVHPLAWRHRPWFFAANVGFLWTLLQIGTGGGVPFAYRGASLVVALGFVLLTTTGDDEAPRYGRERDSA